MCSFNTVTNKHLFLAAPLKTCFSLAISERESSTPLIHMTQIISDLKTNVNLLFKNILFAVALDTQITTLFHVIVDRYTNLITISLSPGSAVLGGAEQHELGTVDVVQVVFFVVERA